jgi:hypothetical protein
MWSWFTSRWQSASLQHAGPPEDLPQPPEISHSPRLRQRRLSSGITIYTIEADLVKEHNHSLETSMLFLITTCVAVVDYCLLNRREQTNPETQSLQLDLESSEYLEICFRLRRCGAAKVTPGLISREEDCQIALEERLNSSPFGCTLSHAQTALCLLGLLGSAV